MRLWTANVGRGADNAKFRRNIARVKRAAGPLAVICFQEIDEADVPNEMDDIQRMFRETHEIVGDNLAVPVLVPKRFETFGHRVRIGSPGLAKFTPRRPINRIGVTLPLTRRQMADMGVTSLGVYVFNFHNPISRPQTQALRKGMIEAVREEVAAVRADGFGGVWAADTNWRKARDGAMPRVVTGERPALGGRVGTPGEIDVAKAWAGKGSGLRVVVRDRRNVDLNIDGHNAHGADVLWLPDAAR